MKKLFLGIFLFLGMISHSQQIQWASKIIKFSSDLGGKQNGIKRVLGKPDAFPQGGPSPNAWTPKNALDGWETIEVGFETPQTVKQIAIFENLNAGCVFRIKADTDSGKYETVWTRKIDRKTPFYSSSIPADRNYYYNRKRRKVEPAPNVTVNSGIEHAILETAVSGVVAIRVEFSFALMPGQKQIDAIGISDSEVPILPKINTLPAFENLPDIEKIPLGDLQPTNPIISSNGNLLFTGTKSNDQDAIYTCQIQDGKWQPVSETEISLNQNKGYNYVEVCSDAFAVKGGMEYNRGTGETGFEFLKLINGHFEQEALLKITAYNNYDNTADLSITADRKTIVMGIESDMSQGGADLYFTTRKEDGTYGLLQNMGKTINSAADENMPCLLSDEKTLLFSSNGFSSNGDFDLYVSYRLDDTWKKWSEPINLGSKINGGSFEGQPFYDEKNELLYFVKTTDGQNGIYTVRIPKTLMLQKE